MHEIPSLKYKYSDLEPYIDEETMRLHHTKHHQAYVDKLNQALENYPDLARLPIEELLKDLGKIPDEIRLAVTNNGGGHYNHSLFWEMIGPTGKESKERTLEVLDKFFGGMDGFKEQFKQAALSRFGSGWAWLIWREGRVEILSTPNQDAPISTGAQPLLGIDVWEHAYYLKYQNRRPEYVDAFFRIIDWDQVEQNLQTTIAIK